MKKAEKKIEINQILDRNKVLDEALFLGICGRNIIEEDGSYMTAVIRLEMAIDKLDKVIRLIHKEKL